MADGCHIGNRKVAMSMKNRAILMKFGTQMQIWNSMTVT